MVTDHLSGQLARWFCDVNYTLRAPGTRLPALRGDRIDFQNVRVTDKVTVQLGRMGFLQPGETRSVWPYTLKVNAADMPRLSAEVLCPTPEDKQSLLDLVICHAADHRDVPVGKAWFEPPELALRLMELLATAGFAERDGHRYRWTDLIAPSMLASCLWNAKGQTADDPDFSWGIMMREE